MQSSAAVTFRAALMLVCLIAVPLAAIMGAPLRDAVIGWLDGLRGPRASMAPSEALPAQPFAAGRDFAAAGGATPNQVLGPPGDSAPRWAGTTEISTPPTAGPTSPIGPAPLWSPQSSTAATQPTGALPAGYAVPNAAADQPAHTFGGATQLGGFGPAGGADPHQGNYDVQPQAQAVPGSWTSNVAADTGQEGVAGMAADRFLGTQQRLRDLGATYYLLETWGDRGQLYRFHCKVAAAGNPHYVRHFEATDSDALRAMHAVLQQVEAWHRPVARQVQPSQLR